MNIESEDRMEAADKVTRYYEIQGTDEPDHNSEEWRERFAMALDDIQGGW